MDMPDLEALLGVKAVFVKAGTAGAIVGAVIQKVPDWREAVARRRRKGRNHANSGVGLSLLLSSMWPSRAIR
jgi:hypothetical protein